MAQRRECVEFEGRKYYRYPDSLYRTSRVYFQTYRVPRNSKRKSELLHRAIWKSLHGPIPKGHDVHHADDDPLNNAPGNLECLTKKEHAARHPQKPQLELLARMQILAKKWHASPVGRRWHSKHAKEAWASKVPKSAICTFCGKEFWSLLPKKFCSRLCISRANESTKRYYVQCWCIICGRMFLKREHKKRCCCSHKCVWELRRRDLNRI